jgi:hypothetical protein
MLEKLYSEKLRLDELLKIIKRYKIHPLDEIKDAFEPIVNEPFLLINNINTMNSIFDIFSFLNTHVMYLNNSKFFAGVIMIVLNMCSKFITLQFSKSTEEYLKMTVTTQLMVFAMAWMGTRDIYTALVLTAVFTILSEHIFNEESHMCIVPYKYRILNKLVDTNNDGIVSDKEVEDAIQILEKARKNKERMNQIKNFTLFGNYLETSNPSP